MKKTVTDEGTLIIIEKNDDKDVLKDMFVKDDKFYCSGCERVLPISKRKKSMMMLNFCEDC